MAKRAMVGNYGISAAAFMILTGILFVVFMVLYIGILVSLFTAVGMGSSSYAAMAGMGIGSVVLVILVVYGMLLLEYMLIPGFCRMYYNICKKNEVKIGDLFFAFRNSFGKFFGLSMLMILLVILLSVLQLILSAVFGLIAPLFYMIISMVITYFIFLNYGLVYYILVDDTQMKLMDALKLSKKYMVGNKGRMFVLGLSFIGWFILSYLTCYLAFLWLIPYMGCTFMFFYLDVKEEYEQKNSQTVFQSIE